MIRMRRTNQTNEVRIRANACIRPTMHVDHFNTDIQKWGEVLSALQCLSLNMQQRGLQRRFKLVYWIDP